MTAFPTAAHLCPWAGVSPGQHESAGRRKTPPTRAGNRHIKAALGTAAMSTTRQRNTYLGAKYRRIAARPGKLRAVVAIERAILTAVWHIAQHRHLLPRPRTGLLQQARPQQTRSPCQPTSKPSATRSPFTPSRGPTKPTNSPVSYQRDKQLGQIGPNEFSAQSHGALTPPPQSLIARSGVQNTTRPPIRGQGVASSISPARRYLP
jgi:Transposase IS116/IS110/IS902 family